jgi:hypothetical protein
MTKALPNAMALRAGASGRVIEYTIAQKMPMARMTSPMLTTSRMKGIGSGMTSPNSPPEATNAAIVSTRSRKWNGSFAICAAVKPAASYAAAQIGMRPAFSRIASMFAPMPIAAICSPGTRQFCQSHTKMSP